MEHDTDASVLLGLDGLAVTAVRRGADGLPEVEVVTADEQAARVCPGCGTPAARVKGSGDDQATGPGVRGPAGAYPLA